MSSLSSTILVSTILALISAFLPPFAWSQLKTIPNHLTNLAFVLPVHCDFPEECYIQSYVDLDPGPGIQDRSCGIHTYDNHKGTDFRLRSLDLMDRGIPVVAVAGGKVVRTRDGMRDVHMGLFGQKLAFRRGAGNHVVIDHGSGWRTLYGHMRQGSVTVKAGDSVKPGQQIGLVGMSGLTEFPHLHFEISKFNSTIDPFIGLANTDNCKGPKQTLWTSEALEMLSYRDRFLIATGFADMPLSREALLYQLHVSDRISRKAPNLVFHVDFAGLRAGDIYELRIYAPDGNIFAENRTLSNKDIPVSFRLLGRKIAKRRAWPTGEYRGEFILYREKGGEKSIFIHHKTRMIVN